MGSGASAVVDIAEPGTEANSAPARVAQHLCREADAACAYDVAEQRFHGRDAVTNFRLLTVTDPAAATPELRFLASRSKVEVVGG
jgi:hypothetical protein